MSDNDMNTLDSERKELDHLMHKADLGHLAPIHWSRLHELGRRMAAADGALADGELFQSAPPRS